MPPSALAQTAPAPMPALSPAFAPALLKGIIIDEKDPFKFEFIVDQGTTPKPADIKDESTRLIKYFLAALTTPETDLWVNLSPYEKDRIVNKEFGATAMGRDLLAQDYLLKQITASLLHPDSATGKAFWEKIYAQAYAKFGTTDIPVDTFNKVWITPDSATVYTNGPKAYIVNCKLKVLLENDYLASSSQGKAVIPRPKVLTPLGAEESQSILGSLQPSAVGMTKDILREVIIPVLENEVNAGANFAPLRQVYHSLILAAWFKRKMKESLLTKTYVDRQKTHGLEAKSNDPETIWSAYVETFKKGVYNFIREENDPVTGETIPRKYFSGGFSSDSSQLDQAIHFTADAAGINSASSVIVNTNLATTDPPALMMDAYEKIIASLKSLNFTGSKTGHHYGLKSVSDMEGYHFFMVMDLTDNKSTGSLSVLLNQHGQITIGDVFIDEEHQRQGLWQNILLTIQEPMPAGALILIDTVKHLPTLVDLARSILDQLAQIPDQNIVTTVNEITDAPPEGFIVFREKINEIADRLIASQFKKEEDGDYLILNELAWLYQQLYPLLKTAPISTMGADTKFGKNLIDAGFNEITIIVDQDAHMISLNGQKTNNTITPDRAQANSAAISASSWEDIVRIAHEAPERNYTEILTSPDGKPRLFRGVIENSLTKAIDPKVSAVTSIDGKEPAWWGTADIAIATKAGFDPTMPEPEFVPGTTVVLFEITEATARAFNMDAGYGLGKTWRPLPLAQIARAWAVRVDSKESFQKGLVGIQQLSLPGMSAANNAQTGTQNTPTSIPMTVRQDTSGKFEAAFQSEIISDALQQRVMDVIAGRDRANILISGRTFEILLPEPIMIADKKIDRLTVKGAVDSKPVPYDDTGHAITQPKGKILIGIDGAIEMENGHPSPLGTMLLFNVMEEYNGMRRAFKAGIPTGIPIGYGRWSWTYEGEPVGFVITAEEGPREGLLEALRTDLKTFTNPRSKEPERTRAFQEISTIVSEAASILRKTHQAGIIHRQAKLHQFRKSAGKIKLYDFETSLITEGFNNDAVDFWILKDAGDLLVDIMVQLPWMGALGAFYEGYTGETGCDIHQALGFLRAYRQFSQQVESDKVRLDAFLSKMHQNPFAVKLLSVSRDAAQLPLKEQERIMAAFWNKDSHVLQEHMARRMSLALHKATDRQAFKTLVANGQLAQARELLLTQPSFFQDFQREPRTAVYPGGLDLRIFDLFPNLEEVHFINMMPFRVPYSIENLTAPGPSYADPAIKGKEAFEIKLEDFLMESEYARFIETETQKGMLHPFSEKLHIHLSNDGKFEIGLEPFIRANLEYRNASDITVTPETGDAETYIIRFKDVLGIPRTIYFHQADAFNAAKYPPTLKKALEQKVDMFFIKAFTGNYLQFPEELRTGVKGRGLFVKDRFPKGTMPLPDHKVFFERWGLERTGEVAGKNSPWGAMGYSDHWEGGLEVFQTPPDAAQAADLMLGLAISNHGGPLDYPYAMTIIDKALMRNKQLLERGVALNARYTLLRVVAEKLERNGGSKTRLIKFTRDVNRWIQDHKIWFNDISEKLDTGTITPSLTIALDQLKKLIHILEWLSGARTGTPPIALKDIVPSTVSVKVRGQPQPEIFKFFKRPPVHFETKEIPVRFTEGEDITLTVDHLPLVYALARLFSNSNDFLEKTYGIDTPAVNMSLSARRSGSRAVMNILVPGHIDDALLQTGKSGKQKLYELNPQREDFHHGVGSAFAARVFELTGATITTTNVPSTDPTAVPMVRHEIAFDAAETPNGIDLNPAALTGNATADIAKIRASEGYNQLTSEEYRALLEYSINTEQEVIPQIINAIKESSPDPSIPISTNGFFDLFDNGAISTIFLTSLGNRVLKGHANLTRTLTQLNLPQGRRWKISISKTAPEKLDVVIAPDSAKNALANEEQYKKDFARLTHLFQATIDRLGGECEIWTDMLFHNESHLTLKTSFNNNSDQTTRAPGGIDLNPAKLALQETSAAATPAMDASQAFTMPVEISGLVPVILNIRPAGNLKELLTAAP